MVMMMTELTRAVGTCSVGCSRDGHLTGRPPRCSAKKEKKNIE